MNESPVERWGLAPKPWHQRRRLGALEAPAHHSLKASLDVLTQHSVQAVRGFPRDGETCPQGTQGSVWRRSWVVTSKGGVLLASGGWGPGMLANIALCTGQPPRRATIQPQMSAVPKWRNWGAHYYSQEGSASGGHLASPTHLPRSGLLSWGCFPRWLAWALPRSHTHGDLERRPGARTPIPSTPLQIPPLLTCQQRVQRCLLHLSALHVLASHGCRSRRRVGTPGLHGPSGLGSQARWQKPLPRVSRVCKMSQRARGLAARCRSWVNH